MIYLIIDRDYQKQQYELLNEIRNVSIPFNLITLGSTEFTKSDSRRSKLTNFFKRPTIINLIKHDFFQHLLYNFTLFVIWVEVKIKSLKSVENDTRTYLFESILGKRKNSLLFFLGYFIPEINKARQLLFIYSKQLASIRENSTVVIIEENFLAFYPITSYLLRQSNCRIILKPFTCGVNEEFDLFFRSTASSSFLGGLLEKAVLGKFVHNPAYLCGQRPFFFRILMSVCRFPGIEDDLFSGFLGDADFYFMDSDIDLPALECLPETSSKIRRIEPIELTVAKKRSHTNYKSTPLTFDEHKSFGLIFIPPNQGTEAMATSKFQSFTYLEAIKRFINEILRTTRNTHVWGIVDHPRSDLLQIDGLENFTYDWLTILNYVDRAVVCNSAVARILTAAGVQTFNFDFYNYNYHETFQTRPPLLYNSDTLDTLLDNLIDNQITSSKTNNYGLETHANLDFPNFWDEFSLSVLQSPTIEY